MGEEAPAPATQILPLVDKYTSPSFFTNGVHAYFVHDSALMITFEVAHYDVTAPQGENVSRVVAGRVHMPIIAAQRMALTLYDYLKNMGFDPSAIIKTEGDPTKPQ